MQMWIKKYVNINSKDISKSKEWFCEEALESKNISATILIQFNSYTLSVYHAETKSTPGITRMG